MQSTLGSKRPMQHCQKLVNNYKCVWWWSGRWGNEVIMTCTHLFIVAINKHGAHMQVQINNFVIHNKVPIVVSQNYEIMIFCPAQIR